MKTIELNLYTIDELSDKAKERARDWYKNGMEFHWCDESRESIQAFCEAFGVKLKSWECCAYSPYYFSTDAENSNFRGVKLSDFKPDHTPTGYYLDWPLWSTFHLEFGRTGDAKAAFVEALHAGFRAWREDMESQLDDEYIDEHLAANGYTFTADGERFDA